MGLTGSGIGRVSLCLSAELLPKTRHAGNRWTSWGNVAHEFLCRANTDGRDEALAAAPAEHRDALGLIELDKLPVDPKCFVPEVTWRYSVKEDTAVEVARGQLVRNYGEHDGPWEVWGTADVLGVTPDAVIIIDYKTGWADHDAKTSAQLKFYALAACRTYGRTRATVFICRIRDDGTPFYDSAEFSLFELDGFAQDLFTLCDRLEDARKQDPAEWRTTEGEHCRHCPALPHCPAKAKLLAALGTGSAFPAVIDASNARAVYERLQVARALVVRVDEAFDLYARAHPVDLGGGFTYGAVEQPKESLDPILARPILEKVGLSAAIEVLPKLTKSALEDEVRRVVSAKFPQGPKPKGILGRTLKGALDALRAAGAATTARQTVVRRFKRKDQLPAGALPNSSGEVPITPQQDGPQQVGASKGAGQPPLEVLQGGLE